MKIEAIMEMKKTPIYCRRKLDALMTIAVGNGSSLLKLVKTDSKVGITQMSMLTMIVMAIISTAEGYAKAFLIFALSLADDSR